MDAFAIVVSDWTAGFKFCSPTGRYDVHDQPRTSAEWFVWLYLIFLTYFFLMPWLVPILVILRSVIDALEWLLE